MKSRMKRPWWPWFAGAMTGYIVWDIFDHTVLQPQSGILGSYLLDWGVVGLVGLTTVLVVSRHSVQQLPVIHDPAAGMHISPVVFEHMVVATHSLDLELAEINAAVGEAIATDGLTQQRSLRQAMVAAHNAQSFSDEIAGLMSTPRMAPPPSPDQLSINNYH